MAINGIDNAWSLEAFREYVGRILDEVRNFLIDKIDERDKRYYERFGYIDQKFLDFDLRYQQRFDAQQKALADALAAQEKALGAALGAADRAVTKAEIAAEKRFESVNEFRAVLTTQSAEMATKSELLGQVTGLAEKFDFGMRNLTDKIDGPTGVAGQVSEVRTQISELRASYDTRRKDKADRIENAFKGNQNWIGVIAIIVSASVALWVAMSRPQAPPMIYPQSPSYGTQNVNPPIGPK